MIIRRKLVKNTLALWTCILNLHIFSAFVSDASRQCVMTLIVMAKFLATEIYDLMRKIKSCNEKLTVAN